MSVRRLASCASAAVTLAGAGLVGATALAPAAFAGAVSVQFDQPGGPYTWTVPAGVTAVHVDAVGGSGGPGYTSGGAGAEVQADLPVTPGTALEVYVAGNGSGGAGGVNGGGGGYSWAGGGGGASDVRAGGEALTDRILVAAGGGGGSGWGTAGAAGQPGTNGGGCNVPAAQPGTDLAGGAGGGGCDGSAGTDGALGVGGVGGQRPSGNDYGGGGGGGYYGGGGGGPYGGGGGGSNYVSSDGTSVQTSLAALGAAPYVHISFVTPPAAVVAVTTSAASLPADGVSTATVTATADDANGNPVPGDTVSFQSSDPGLQFGPVTDHGDGTYTATVTSSTTSGLPTITATDASGTTPVSGTTPFAITALPQTVAITNPPPTSSPIGSSYDLTATGGGSGNPVIFSVDPTTSNASTSNAACAVTAGQVVLQHSGNCVLDADQAGNAQYAAAPTQQLTVAVDPATTQTGLRVLPRTLVATVATSDSRLPSPEGTVTFAVDGLPVATATLSQGVARAAYTVSPGKTRAVSATYSGSTDFLPSSASTARHDPAVTARLHSAARITRYGWYRNPVTVTFSCTTHGAPLVGNCPSPVRLSHNGAAESVSRTIRATDGGAATVTLTGIAIDTVAPRVTISGPRAGAVYAGTAPRAACVAHDKLSGVATCTVHTTALPAPNGETVRYRAAATDKAGNRAVRRGSYRIVSNYLAGAPFRNGAFDVRQGATYTLVVRTATNRAPRFYDAVPAGQQPKTFGSLMHRAGMSGGMHVWELPVRIDTGLDRYPIWNLGVRTTDGMQLIRFRPAH